MDQENKASAKSNKVLYIIIAIVVLVLLGWYFKNPMSEISGVDVDNNMDGSVTYKKDGSEITIGTNKLPDNWPSDAPKYPNAKIQYSGTSNPQTGAEGSALVFTTTDKVQAVLDFYKKELASNGWKIDQTSNMAGASVISATKESWTFGAYIVDSGEGQVSVTVGINKSK